MINRERRKGMDPQVSLRRPATGSNLGFRCLYGVENLPRSIEKDVAFGSQCEPPGGAIEKAHTEARLQPRDELRNRRGRQTEITGSCRETAALNHPGEDVHLVRRIGHSRIQFMSESDLLLIVCPR